MWSWTFRLWGSSLPHMAWNDSSLDYGQKKRGVWLLIIISRLKILETRKLYRKKMFLLPVLIFACKYTANRSDFVSILSNCRQKRRSKNLPSWFINHKCGIAFSCVQDIIAWLNINWKEDANLWNLYSIWDGCLKVDNANTMVD